MTDPVDKGSVGPVAGLTSSQRNLLKHPLREGIVEELDASPGLNISQLADRIDVSRNTISFHLDVLEKHGLVVTTRSSKGRLCFLYHQERLAEEPTTRILFTRPTARDIASLLVRHPGSETSDITEALDRSNSAVLRHLQDLRALDLVERIPDGTGFRYHPTPTLIGWARALEG